jgi:hypothetical protein
VLINQKLSTSLKKVYVASASWTSFATCWDLTIEFKSIDGKYLED